MKNARSKKENLFKPKTTSRSGWKREALRQVILDFKISANEISRRTHSMEKYISGVTGVYPSQISKYLNHGADISSNGLNAIELALPDSAREVYRQMIAIAEANFLKDYHLGSLPLITGSTLEGCIAKKDIKPRMIA